MRISRAIVCTIFAWLLLAPAPVPARDLPFAPPRPKKDENTVIFSPFAHEHLTFKLDRTWIMFNRFNDENAIRVMQFGPEGTQLGDNQEMLNIASYLGVPRKQTAKDFMLHSKKEMQKLVPKDKLSFHEVNTSDPSDVMFEYSIKGWLDSPDQYELQRVIRGKDGIHVVIYHLPTADVSEPDRMRAIAVARSIQVCSNDDDAGKPASAAAAKLEASRNNAAAGTK